MSKKLTIAGFITAKPADAWESDYFTNVIDGVAYRFTPYEPSDTSDDIVVCKHTLTFDIPEGWDPRPGQIAALEAKKAELQREFAAAVVKINQQIASLQAIEYTPEAA